MGLLRFLYRSIFKKIRGFGFGFGIFNTLHRLLWEGILQPKSVEIEGIRLFLQDHDAAVSDTLRMRETWEPEQLSAFKDLLKPGMVFLDGGANIGYYSILAAKIVGETGRVLAFEPDIQNLSLLHKNACANHACRVEIYPYAVSEKIGTADFFIAPEDPAGHSIIAAPVENSTSKRVITIGLEEFLGPDFCPDIVKLDVEGAELAALKGMGKMLANKRLKAIFFECDESLLAKAGSSGREIRDLLAGHGFTFQDITKRDVLALRT